MCPFAHQAMPGSPGARVCTTNQASCCLILAPLVQPGKSTYHEHYVPDGCHPQRVHQLLNDLPTAEVALETHGACRRQRQHTHMPQVKGCTEYSAVLVLARNEKDGRSRR